jgi:hypothetical protein
MRSSKDDRRPQGTILMDAKTGEVVSVSNPRRASSNLIGYRFIERGEGQWPTMPVWQPGLLVATLPLSDSVPFLSWL